MTGILVAIEGADGSGKTTQVAALYNHYAATSTKVAKFRFPEYNTPIGRVLKKQVAGKLSISREAMFALFAANRLERLESLSDHLKCGDLVLCDRYSLSELIYGSAAGLNQRWLLEIEKLMPVPDLLIVLSTVSHILEERRNRRRNSTDIFEENASYQNAVFTAYNQVDDISLGQYGKIIAKVDSSVPVKELTLDLIRRIDALRV